MRQSDALRRLMNAASSYLARNVPMDLPRYRLDGAPINSAYDLAAAANLSVIEARYRLKNLYGDEAGHPVTFGVGTVVQRAQTLSRPKRKKRKKKKKMEN